MLTAMDKKCILILAFALAISVSIIVRTNANLARGNIFPPYNTDDVSAPSVSIISPVNKSYAVNSVQLTFVVTGADSSDIIKYSLDGTLKSQFYGSRTVFENLANLSEGEHTVQIDVYYVGVKLDWAHVEMPVQAEKHQVVHFSVASLPSPSPSIEPSPSPTITPSSSVSPIPVNEVLRNPASYLNQTIYVRGWLQSEPMPAPYVIGMDGDGVLYVKWDPHFFISNAINDSMAVVHGIIKEMTWTNPYINQTEHDYYIDAQTIDFESSSTPSPTIEPTPEPTQASKQTGFFGTSLPVEYGYAIVAVLVIIVVAGLSLVYLKKLRK
jgi:hypothetical protein